MSNGSLITGITGQDGSFLAEQLLKRGDKVIGIVRRSSTSNYGRIQHLLNNPNLELAEGDVTDLSSMIRLIADYRPDYLFNLAAQSFVPTSWEQPLLTAQATGIGAVNIFEAVRIVHPTCRVYQASSSEMFGLQPKGAFQNESTPFYPRSPYACAKAYAHQMAINYRESHGLFISSGILFNHESERRGIQFVTRKITDAVAKIHLGLDDSISLGFLGAERDWGYAKDYVEAMVLMLEQDSPIDCVVATGQRYTVEYFVEHAFATVGLDWKEYVKQDPRYMRPAEVPSLCGDATRAYEKLGWSPTMNLPTLIAHMVRSDIARIEGLQ